jgi:hypothetical protein
MSDLKHYQRLGAATLKADNASRTVRLLQVMSQSNWKIYSASERKQIFRALAEQRDTLRRLNTQVQNIVKYKNNNPKGETRGNKTLVP